MLTISLFTLANGGLYRNGYQYAQKDKVELAISFDALTLLFQPFLMVVPCINDSNTTIKLNCHESYIKGNTKWTSR